MCPFTPLTRHVIDLFSIHKLFLQQGIPSGPYPELTFIATPQPLARVIPSSGKAAWEYIMTYVG